MATTSSTPQAVVGIDFGTAASGFAFAFSENSDIIIDGNLPRNPRYHKSPTVLWRDPEGKFRAFGFDATEGYAQDEFNDRDATEMFSSYKLALISTASDPKAFSESSTEYRLLPLIAQTLAYIKCQAVQRLQDTLGNLFDPKRVVWVVTVPAIWNESAKYAMRQASFEGDLIECVDSPRLLLALEPEAAVASCLHDVVPVLCLATGTKFAMVDCGGGTVDITSHIIAVGGIDDKSSPLGLNELAPPIGGAWGSMKVNENFMQDLMKPLLGSLFDKLNENLVAKFRLLEEFENQIKKPYTSLSLNPRRLNVSYLNCIFSGEDIALKDLVEEYNSKEENADLHLVLVGQTLKLNPATVSRFFDPLVEKIIQTISALLDDNRTIGLKQLFLVGGFGENRYLQERLRAEFEPLGLTISLPPCPGSAVMMGAVRFGLHPDLFATRVSKFTYGVSSTVDGRFKVLDKFVSFGQEVPCGLKVERTYRPVNGDQQWISVIIVHSTNPNAYTILDASVSPLATLRAQVPIHLPFEERLVTVSMKFGSTEILASASIGDIEIASSLDFNGAVVVPVSSSSFTETKSVQFLIDVSSSMADQVAPGRIKLDDAKAGIKFVVDSILQEGKDSVALSTFSNEYSKVFEETVIDKPNVFRAVDAMGPSSSTHFYAACVTQLEIIGRLPRDKKRFVLVFTDGEDNSSSNFANCPSFIQLKNILQEVGGVCDSHLTRFFVIAVGLREAGLKPLRELTESGNLTLLSFEKATDIRAAFQIASEEIEKVDSNEAPPYRGPAVQGSVM